MTPFTERVLDVQWTCVHDIQGTVDDVIVDGKSTSRQQRSASSSRRPLPWRRRQPGYRRSNRVVVDRQRPPLQTERSEETVTVSDRVLRLHRGRLLVNRAASLEMSNPHPGDNPTPASASHSTAEAPRQQHLLLSVSDLSAPHEDGSPDTRRGDRPTPVSASGRATNTPQQPHLRLESSSASVSGSSTVRERVPVTGRGGFYSADAELADGRIPIPATGTRRASLLAWDFSIASDPPSRVPPPPMLESVLATGGGFVGNLDGRVSAFPRRRRLTHYIAEPNVGHGYIKEIAFGVGGRVVASPFGYGVRLLAFDPDCGELCDRTADFAASPVQLHELVTNVCHGSVVVTAKFSPDSSLLVTGSLGGRVGFHRPRW